MGGPKETLVTSLQTAAGDTLRDVWLFDEDSYESLYLRDDVADHVAELDVARYIDNERYGYVTRETYESLHYTDYEYTIRGFDEFVQYRTFLGAGDDRVGLMASFDPDVTLSFREITRELCDSYDCDLVSVASDE